MKKIKAGVANCMTGFEHAGRSITSRFLFPEDFVGFQGHFPQKKILPGVCQIQSALSTVEKAKGGEVQLKEIVLAKYFAPVMPHEEILCSCSEVEESGEFTFKVMIMKGTTKVSELKLRVALTDHESR